jgi:hypothetical protein
VYPRSLPASSRSGSPLTAVSRQLPSCLRRIHQYDSCSANHLISVGFLHTAALWSDRDLSTSCFQSPFLDVCWLTTTPRPRATHSTRRIRHLTLSSPPVIPLPRAYPLITRSLAVCPRACAEPPNQAHRRRHMHTLLPSFRVAPYPVHTHGVCTWELHNRRARGKSAGQANTSAGRRS